MDVERKLKAAAAPFDADPAADIILVTADDKRFLLVQAIIAKISPVFENMLAMPRPPPSSPDTSACIRSLPTVRVSNSSAVMDHFLRCCYPGTTPPRLQTPQEALELSKAGDMYMNDTVKSYSSAEFTRLVQAIPATSVQSAVDLFRAYTGAYRMGLTQEVSIAARASLKFSPDVFLHIPPEPEDASPSPDALYIELMQYHYACKVAVKQMCRPQYWQDRPRDPYFSIAPLWDAKREDALHTDECESGRQPCGTGTDYTDDGFSIDDVQFYERSWFLEFRNGIQGLLKRSSLTIEAALHDPDVFQQVINLAYTCPFCRKSAAKSLSRFIQLVDSKLEHEIDKVEFGNFKRLGLSQPLRQGMIYRET